MIRLEVACIMLSRECLDSLRGSYYHHYARRYLAVGRVLLDELAGRVTEAGIHPEVDSSL